MIFFGANDSIIDADGHFPISIENYKLNLEEIIQHPATRAQNPRILLVTPPPVNEYAQIEVDSEKGHSHLRRSAGTTRKYAEACLQVAKSTTGVVGVDIWSALMKEAGWDGDGDRLPGSMQILPNKTLQKLMYDGMLSFPFFPPDIQATMSLSLSLYSFVFFCMFVCVYLGIFGA